MKQVITVFVKIKRGVSRRINKKIISAQLKNVGPNFICDEDVTVYGGENISLGKGVVINKGVILQSCEGATITIGDEVTFSFNSKLITGNLSISDKINEVKGHTTGSIDIGNNVWIGTNVIVLPNICISNNIVVAAGSVVTKSLLEQNSLYAGIPAKKIKEL